MCLRAALLRHESGAGSSKMVHQKYLPLKGSLNKHTHKSRLWDFPDSPGVKNPPASAGTWLQSLVQADSTGRGAGEPEHLNY